MKTIGDLERWLKGAGKDWQVTLYVRRDEFTVAIDKTSADGGVGKSKTLEGALENALEELRRKDNGAESMRTEPAKALTMHAIKAATQKIAFAGATYSNAAPFGATYSTMPGGFCQTHRGYFTGAKCPLCP